MPAKSLDKQIEKIDRDHGKVVELLERELQREREQAEAARAGVEEARSKLEELEESRPGLASEVFAGAAAYADLDAHDSEISRVRRHKEFAALAEEQAGERVPSIEARMQEKEREAASKRYNAFASERKEKALALDDTLDTVTALVDTLLEIDRRQRDEEQNLGMAGGGVAYDEQLENHIMIRIQRYVRPAALAVNGVDMRLQRASLLEKDYKTKTLDEVRTEHETESAGLEAAREQRDAHDEARRTKEKYDQRRAEIHAKYGYTKDITMGADRRTKVDAIVDETLSREFPDLFAQEQRAAMDRRRIELRGMLGYDRPGEKLDPDERAQIEERVNEQLREEFPAVETLTRAV